MVAVNDLYRWLLIGCSLGRNAGDYYSDIDAAVGIADKEYPTAIEMIKKQVRELGHMVDLQDQTLPDELGRTRRHLIVVYDGNLQLSLVVSPSSMVKGLRPDGVALYDVDGVLDARWNPPVKNTTPEQAREWAFLAWLNLADAGKYLNRHSLWEAIERLHRARNNTWQLWAVANRIDFAVYGITQLVDDGIEPPEGMGKTIAIYDEFAIKDACIELMGVLENVMMKAHDSMPFELPMGMAAAARNMILAGTEKSEPSS